MILLFSTGFSMADQITTIDNATSQSLQPIDEELLTETQQSTQATKTMETKDKIQLVATILTFLAAVASIFVTRITASKTIRENANTAQRSRVVSITSMRRKERMEKLIVHFSKLSALFHPSTIKVFAEKKNANYPEELLTQYESIEMLLDSTYIKDVELTKLLTKIVDRALNYFDRCVHGEPLESDVHYLQYIELIQKVKKLYNVFIITEWLRLEIESTTGDKVEDCDWLDLYNINMTRHEEISEAFINDEIEKLHKKHYGE